MIIEHIVVNPYGINAKPVLRKLEISKLLNPALTDSSRLMSEIPLQRVNNGGAPPSIQRLEIILGSFSQADFVHLATL